MPAIKIPRKSTTIDMTAMCDVSFLLLTFFILTAKFNDDQSVIIDVPAARSEIKIDEPLLLSVDKEGKVYFTAPKGSMRAKTLDNLIERYGEKYPQLKTLTDAQKAKFLEVEMVGFPIENLPEVLSFSKEQMTTFKKSMPGIPMDTIQNQLGAWIMAGRYADPEQRIAIKGDKISNIDAVQDVIKTLTRNDVHRFNLITTLEGANR